MGVVTNDWSLHIGSELDGPAVYPRPDQNERLHDDHNTSVRHAVYGIHLTWMGHQIASASVRTAASQLNTPKQTQAIRLKLKFERESETSMGRVIASRR